MSNSPNYSIRNAGKSVRRLCTLITIKDNLRAEAPRSFLSSNASTRDQILLQINQIKILHRKRQGPFTSEDDKQWQRKMDRNMGKVENFSSTFSLKKD